MTYLQPAQIWAPQREQMLLAVLVPETQTTIESEADYLELLAQRVSWLIQAWLEEAETDLPDTHRMLRRAQHQLEPNLWSTPNGPASETAEDLMVWWEEWARVLVEDCGIIQSLLAQTETEFPQPVNLPPTNQDDLKGYFSDPAMDGLPLEEWLSSLIYMHNKG